MSGSEEKRPAGEEEKIDLMAGITQYLKTLKKMIIPVILIILVCAVGFWGYKRLIYTPQYTASVPFVVNSDSSGITSEYLDALTAEEVSSLFREILDSSSLTSLVEEELGLDYLPGTLSMTQVESTKLVNLKATASDPETAYDLLCAVLNNYETVAVTVMGSTTLTLLSEPSVPTSVDNPFNDTGTLVRGALAGLIIGLLLVLAFSVTRFTIKDKKDVKRFININYICSVPRVPGKRTNPKKNPIEPDSENIGFGFKESMRIAASRLVRRIDETDAAGNESGKNTGKVILVTAAASQEGTTTIAMSLAVALASRGKNVVLIDCNFRNAGLERNYPLEGTPPGTLNEVLNGKCVIGNAMTSYKYKNLKVIPCSVQDRDNIRMISNGRLGRLARLITKSADYVFLDCPPAGEVSDAGALAGSCDGVVFVIRQDFTRIAKINRALEDISESGVPIYGCLINRSESAGGGYGYGYGYGRGYGYGYGRGYGYGYGYGYGEEKKKDRAPQKESSVRKQI